jgi:hypothetical protein
MKMFITKFPNAINGSISCFDRVIFKGHLPICWSKRFMGFLYSKGVLFKNTDKYSKAQGQTIADSIENWAKKLNRPSIYVKSSRERKDDIVRQVLADHPTKSGLVCVIRAVESCYGFRLCYGKDRPLLKNAMRKCLCYYAYILDNEFGLLHVRIQTWFPFTIQICMNGHDWLARRMDDAGIEYVQEDNCFTYISDYAKAQELADRFVKLKWVSKLNAFARRVNPLLKTELRRMEYYWCADQAEYATDIVFKDASFLNRLYGKLLNHAIIGLGAADILRFFGKKLDGRFKADQSSHCRKRNPGARVKHWLKNNWIKMYNKHGNVLRVETVVNRPYEFKILRKGKRNGEEITGWFPMGKAVGNLYRYAEVSRQANHAYLDTLAALDPGKPSEETLHQLSRRVKRKGRSHRGFNPADRKDLALLKAISRGEYALNGFRNADIREELYGKSSKKRKRRDAARTTRLFKRLHVRGWIRKLPNSRRWRLTKKGREQLLWVLTIYQPEQPLSLVA